MSSEGYAAYRVCKQRGHVSNGITLTSNPPWSVCKFCGTHYRWSEPQLIEQNVPIASAGNLEQHD